MTKLDHDAMRGILDALAQGYQVAEACATVDVSEGGYWTAKRLSKIAEEEFDTKRFWLTWRGHSDYWHCLLDMAVKSRRHPVQPAVTEWEPGDDPLPPYHRSLRTPAKPEVNPLRPFPPTPTPASPRARPDSPLVRDLMARAAVKPSNPFPLDANGRRTIASTGMRADDPPEHVTTGRN